MAITFDTTTPAPALGAHLRRLYLERALAATSGLSEDGAYMADLQDEIAECRTAYVGAAVIEIAELRAALDRKLLG